MVSTVRRVLAKTVNAARITNYHRLSSLILLSHKLKQRLGVWPVIRPLHGMHMRNLNKLIGKPACTNHSAGSKAITQRCT